MEARRHRGASIAAAGPLQNGRVPSGKVASGGLELPTDSNPWGHGHGDGAVTGVVRLGDLDRVLSLAQATGHLTPAARDACFDVQQQPLPAASTVSVPGHDDPTASRSIQLIEATKRYDKAHTAVLSAALRGHRTNLAGATHDFTEADVLDLKLDLLRDVSAHLSSIQNHIARLEARYHGDIFARDHLLVQSAQQASFVDLVRTAGESLSSVNAQSEALATAQRVIDVDGVALDQTVTDLPRQLQSMVAHFEAIKKARAAILD
eukprot:m.200455 g.200455  ORF g.200455 m.200455 type:complete len:263 (+) comp25204_c0_seq1:206-994(+)